MSQSSVAFSQLLNQADAALAELKSLIKVINKLNASQAVSSNKEAMELKKKRQKADEILEKISGLKQRFSEFEELNPGQERQLEKLEKIFVELKNDLEGSLQSVRDSFIRSRTSFDEMIAAAALGKLARDSISEDLIAEQEEIVALREREIAEIQQSAQRINQMSNKLYEIAKKDGETLDSIIATNQKHIKNVDEVTNVELTRAKDANSKTQSMLFVFGFLIIIGIGSMVSIYWARNRAMQEPTVVGVPQSQDQLHLQPESKSSLEKNKIEPYTLEIKKLKMEKDVPENDQRMILV